MSKLHELENLGHQRLMTSAFPTKDNPRGSKDHSSTNYFRALIKKGDELPPIWIVKKGKRLVLIDGVHRIVAGLQEGLSKIPAYIVKA